MTQRRNAFMLAMAISLSACVSIQQQKPQEALPAQQASNTEASQDVLKLNQWVGLPENDRTVVLIGAIEALALASVSPNNPTPIKSECLLAIDIPGIESQLIAANANQSEDNFVDVLMLASNCL